MCKGLRPLKVNCPKGKRSWPGPCTFNQHVFSNFFKSLKIRTAWRKDFFDTLGRIYNPPLRTPRYKQPRTANARPKAPPGRKKEALRPTGDERPCFRGTTRHSPNCQRTLARNGGVRPTLAPGVQAAAREGRPQTHSRRFHQPRPLFGCVPVVDDSVIAVSILHLILAHFPRPCKKEFDGV